MVSRQTIVAPATSSGEGGVGIIRLSGPLAESSLRRFFHPSLPTVSLTSHRLYHGRFFSPQGELVDEVMAVIMRAPRSYTREDVVEVHCHGGPVVLRQILDHFLDSGLCLARPGEFTLRAFLNGRIDLTRAEAVIDVIRSRSDAACHVALQQLDGRLSSAIYSFRHEVADLLADVESHIDFPDEDIDPSNLEELRRAGKKIALEMDRLLSTFDSGRTLKEGLSVLILGRPNVGKSSLLNALLGEPRAIVTEVAGTTRDTIEESLTIGSIPVRLVDAAGVRHTDDLVEAEGVRRARQKVSSADLVLLVIDGSRPVDEDDHLALEACGKARVLLVNNKCDLPAIPLGPPFNKLNEVRVSAHTGNGIEDLCSAIAGLFAVDGGNEGRESVLLSDRRHREALLRSRRAIAGFCDGTGVGLSPELLALELRDALEALGEITGETTPDEILDKIFSRFCIGK